MFNYPVDIIHLDNGDVMVQFPDIPEAITYGDNEKFALEWAQDALHVALTSYVEDHRHIPKPSNPNTNQKTVSPAPMVGVKLCLYQEMKDKSISQLKLAKLLHCDAKQVRRLLDLDHQSTVSQLIDASEVLGFHLNIELEKKQNNNISALNN
ncbi:MAG: type II toxin-antitoxin system HicB family antitoxin [Thermodesulfobacteriota bacterium]